MTPQITEAGLRYAKSAEFAHELSLLAIGESHQSPEDVCGLMIHCSAIRLCELTEGEATDAEMQAFCAEHFELLRQIVRDAIGVAADQWTQLEQAAARA